MKKIHLLTLLLTVAFLGGSAQKQPLKFAPQWFPQAQFAGYYAALDQGFYEEAGLDLKILHPTDDESSMKLLRTGKADVMSSFLMDALSARLSKDVPLVNIAQLSQHSSLMFVSKAKSRIDTITELDGKKVAIWSAGFDKMPRALMKEKNNEVDFVPIYNTINLFLEGGVDAMTVMYYNEYDQIINSGVNKDELNTFFFSDYEGFDIPEDGLYCLESTYRERKEELKKFVDATLQGWSYVEQNKEYALNLVVERMDKARLANNRAHQRWMLNRILDLLAPGDKDVKRGHLLESDFRRALNVIQSETRLEAEMQQMNFNEFYKPLAN